MQNDWIIDVLADVKAFAKANGLPILAAQLEETALVAAIEMASKADGAAMNECGETLTDRTNIRAVGAGYRT
jgi:hypothetical protein